MIITAEKLAVLRKNGLDFYGVNQPVSPDFCFEAPCSLKFTTVEQQCRLGAFSYIVSGFLCGVDIGRYCSFGENVQIGRQNHPMHWLSTSPFLYLNNHDILDVDETFDNRILTEQPVYSEPATQLKKTVVKNDVWIGHGAIINAGITIDNGAVIAAGSVVTKDVPAYSVVGGNPAKLIRYRFAPNIITQLQYSQWWQYTPQELKGFPVNDVEQLMRKITDLEEQLAIKDRDADFIKISDLI